MYGIRLKKYREAAGFTRTEVARALGITVTMITRYECDEALPDIAKFRMLANLYHTSTDELCGNVVQYCAGPCLAELRKLAGRSLSETAKLLRIKPGEYAEIENGVRDLSRDAVKRVCEFLGAADAAVELPPLVYSRKLIGVEERFRSCREKMSPEQFVKLVEFLETINAADN